MRGTPEERFWIRVNKTNSCWLWTGAINSSGYGSVGIAYKTIAAHRFSWELHNGPIPDGLCVLHNCPDGDNPACVNPAHLWLGTKKDNSDDRDKKGRNINLRGEQHGYAKLTEAKVRAIFEDFGNGMSKAKITRKYNVGYSQISRVLSKEHWGWLWE